MRKKKALLTSLVTLLFFSMAIARVGADAQPVVWVDPPSVTVPTPGIGLNFTVNVWVSDVTYLYGYDFMLYWDTALLDLTDVEVTQPAVWGADYWIMKNDTSVPGRYWHGVSAHAPAPPFNGSTSLVTLTFNCKALGGPSALDLDETKLAEWPTADPIAHTTTDGEVTVAPELSPPPQRAPFPLVNVVILILVAVFFVVALYYLRKRIS